MILNLEKSPKIDRLGSGHRQACCRVRVWQVVVDEYFVSKQFVRFALNDRRREDRNRVCVSKFRAPDIRHDACLLYTSDAADEAYDV